MTVGGLWWLGESVVTLGTMVEIIDLLTTHSPPLLPSEAPVIHAMTCLNNVFTSVQVNNHISYCPNSLVDTVVYNCTIYGLSCSNVDTS